MREYVAEIKGKVKPDYLLRAILDAITADSATDYYAPFGLGYCEFPSYQWKIEIGKRGVAPLVRIPFPLIRGRVAY